MFADIARIVSGALSRYEIYRAIKDPAPIYIFYLLVGSRRRQSITPGSDEDFFCNFQYVSFMKNLKYAICLSGCTHEDTIG